MKRILLALGVAFAALVTANAAHAQPGTGTLGYTYEYKVYSAVDVSGQVQYEVEIKVDGTWRYSQTYTDYDGLVRYLLRTLDETRVTVHPLEPNWVYEATFDNYEDALIFAEGIEWETGRITRIEQVISDAPRDLTRVSKYDLIEIPDESILDPMPMPNPYSSELRLAPSKMTMSFR